MRIVQMLPSLDVGGMERLVIALARKQKETGHESILYCLSHSGTLAPQAEAHGLQIRIFHKRPGFSFSTIRDITRMLHIDRPEVVHTHNALVHHYGVIAAKLARIPVVVNTRHGYGSLAWDAKRETIFKTMANWTDAIVLVTKGVQDYFVTEQRIARHRTRVIMNGAEVDQFLRRPANPGSRRPVIRFGTVGRLAPPKNHVLLVRAFAALLPQFPAAELHLLGDGECRREIESCIAELGLQERVTLHGFSNDVSGFLSTLDVFVLSSLSEGLPLAVLEAMAAGLPIVATRLPGVEDVAPEGVVAWYSNPGDQEALAAAMSQAALSPDLAALGETARALAAKHSTADMWKQYQELFESLLRVKNAPFALAS